MQIPVIFQIWFSQVLHHLPCRDPVIPGVRTWTFQAWAIGFSHMIQKQMIYSEQCSARGPLCDKEAWRAGSARVATMLHIDSHKASRLTCTLAPCGRWAVAALWSEHPAAVRLPFAGRGAACGHEACSRPQHANTLSFFKSGLMNLNQHWLPVAAN